MSSTPFVIAVVCVCWTVAHAYNGPESRVSLVLFNYFNVEYYVTSH